VWLSGQVNGRHDACLDKVIALCRSASWVLELPPNILHYLWCNMPSPAGCGRPWSKPAVFRRFR